jgi:hypothetical protein
MGAAGDENRDAPALRSVAIIDLKPSGPWQQLEDDQFAQVRASIDAMLAHLTQGGVDHDEAIEEDWGVFVACGHLELALGPMDDETGWRVQLGRSPDRAVPDDANSRHVLLALDAALRKMRGVTTVRWYKREQSPEEPGADSPIQA